MKFWAALACVVGATAGLAAQATFRSGVAAVRLDVLVVDDGRPVAGLTSSDFEVFDDGVRQEIKTTWAESSPLDVVFALDRSESVVGETLNRLKHAVQATLAVLMERDRAAVLTFAHNVSLDATLQSNGKTLLGALDTVQARGATALFDAVYSAIAVADGGDRRSLILVFSDGFENRSWMTEDEVVRAARSSETVICSVAFVPPDGGGLDSQTPPPNMKMLRRLSEASGGEVVTVRQDADLGPTFLRILETMRARYLLTYSPSGVASRGWHDVRVRLKRRPGKVIARPGYLVR